MKRQLIACLTASFLSFCTLATINHANASTNKEVTASSLTVRTGPSVKYSAIGYLKKGANVTVYNTVNGWDKITYKGKNAYLSNSYLKIKSVTSTTASTAYKKVTADSLTVRSGSAATYKALDYLKKGKVVKVVSTHGTWLKISYDNKTGYVNGKYLATTSAPVSTTAKTMYVNSKDGLNIRSTKSSKGTLLKTIPNNTKVSVSSISNGWGKVTYGGKTGYVNVTYLTTKTPTTTTASSKTMYVSASDGLNLRSSKNYTSTLLKEIPFATKVSVSSISNGWGKVTYGGKTGYVNVSYLSTTKPSTTQVSKNLSGKKITIDPGHGGKFAGAQGFVAEEDVNLQIALKVRTKLQSMGATVIMTRTSDVHLSTVLNSDLVARSNIAKNNKSNAFVSIHANSATASAKGAETFYYNKTRDYKLAENIYNELVTTGGMGKRSVKYGNLAVLRNSGSFPSTLIETGFVTNKDDAAKIGGTTGQNKIAQAIANGISKTLK